MATSITFGPKSISSQKTTQVESISDDWLQVSQVEKFQLTGHTSSNSKNLIFPEKIVKKWRFATFLEVDCTEKIVKRSSRTCFDVNSQKNSWNQVMLFAFK